MPLVLVETYFFAKLVQFPVDFDANESRAAQVAELLAVFAFATANDRRQDVNARRVGPAHDAVDDLLDALRRYFATAVIAEWLSDAGVEQSEVVVDLGNGADGGARISRGGFLFDREGGGEGVDRIDFRLFHLLQDLPRVDGARLNASPLPFRIDSVEGRR